MVRHHNPRQRFCKSALVHISHFLYEQPTHPPITKIISHTVEPGGNQIDPPHFGIPPYAQAVRTSFRGHADYLDCGCTNHGSRFMSHACEGVFRAVSCSSAKVESCGRLLPGDGGSA